MFVFVFNHVSELTDNYHSGGGLVIAAANVERANELARETCAAISDAEIADAIVYPVKGKAAERVFVFPDAGCC